jgi:hypothetical protein
MKRHLGITRILLLVGLSIGLVGCETLPIKGKVCYVTKDGEICAESDGRAVVVSGNVNASTTVK